MGVNGLQDALLALPSQPSNYIAPLLACSPRITPFSHPTSRQHGLKARVLVCRTLLKARVLVCRTLACPFYAAWGEDRSMKRGR